MTKGSDLSGMKVWVTLLGKKVGAGADGVLAGGGENLGWVLG